ncbi:MULTISPECIES: glycosyltransferase family 9 protein [unclassified Janthinobacterium]|uniref:glycosyltransferase family 9 protein n=1 Tax=unclassified Janthinobacterium TaxID=2610881 RepID=UPI0003477F5A|nr:MULTISPECIES: glycosyltransferase family 9 protein [unclassified Janthinobacterium]MEC5159803.1 heptosyltransferase-3 [Janthinobacterium sp. CG_S6]
MTHTLIPADLLRKSDKILFIAHLALGDFTYLQNCFRAFKQAHPHLQVHLWVDEVRRTADAAQWDGLKTYSLYDWVRACGCFDKVYSDTYSPALYQQSIAAAQRENYPLVVSLATLRPHLYAGLARAVSPRALVVGMKKTVGFFQPHHHLAYRKLDAALAPYDAGRDGPRHISDVYADWFRQLCGLDLAPAARFPFVDIPERWHEQARARLAGWGFAPRSGKLVFVNPFAKTHKRCWPLERVAELIAAMRQRDGWRDACFIVNAVPSELANARSVIASYGLERTELFSAEENFFQLPAMLAQCDLIVSVETAVMHLANAVHVPVVALMRQKNPEWVPLDQANSSVITAARRSDWVKAIPVAQVMKALP